VSILGAWATKQIEARLATIDAEAFAILVSALADRLGLTSSSTERTSACSPARGAAVSNTSFPESRELVPGLPVRVGPTSVVGARLVDRTCSAARLGTL
jgi:hypothetical protein